MVLDGRRIAFNSHRDGNGEIYLMNADGSGQRILASNPSTQEDSPMWSPDGRTITFRTDRDGNSELYAMNADGSEPRNLTRNAAYDSPGLWSPAVARSSSRAPATHVTRTTPSSTS